MDTEIVKKLIQQKQTEDSIRQEFEQTLSERVIRYLAVKPHGIIPNTKFAPASSECSLLFRDGHFYGCIALVQAVAEALMRLLCQTNKIPLGEFENNLKQLFEAEVITDGIRKSFLKIWERRNDYHHLNPTVETDRQELEKIAKEKASLLVEAEKEIFSFVPSTDGKLIPKEPKYWEGCNNQVFLRLEP
ncbi:MAG: hypothetical protein Q8N56_03625 [bacterium]|nr:hypothetical protein [bacterium]